MMTEGSLTHGSRSDLDDYEFPFEKIKLKLFLAFRARMAEGEM